MAYYQNGTDSDKKGWYRGRVSDVNDNKENCHIAYDNGDYEEFVPISIDGEHKIRLLAKRRDSADWLAGIEIGKVLDVIQSGEIRELTAKGE